MDNKEIIRIGSPIGLCYFSIYTTLTREMLTFALLNPEE